MKCSDHSRIKSHKSFISKEAGEKSASLVFDKKHLQIKIKSNEDSYY